MTKDKVSEEICEHCQEFRRRTKIPIGDDSLLATALTHKGAKHLKFVLNDDYEKLEFLGDAVFEAAVSAVLLEDFSDLELATITSMRTVLRSKEEMSTAAGKLGIVDFIIYSPENFEKISSSMRIHCDVFESVLAALYLTKGEAAVKRLIRKSMGGRMRELVENRGHAHATCIVATIAEKLGRGQISFQMIRHIPPLNRPSFEMAIIMGGREIASGIGRSKKEAVRNAAVSYLQSEEGTKDCIAADMNPPFSEN